MMSVGNETYVYGIDGLRTKINNNQQVYDQGAKLLSDGSNKYLWDANGNLLSQAPLGTGLGGFTQQAVNDSHGTVHAIMEATAPGTPAGFDLIASYSYSPFGERTLTFGSNVSIFGFMGEQHDTTGLIYLRSRYYDPSVGQFISTDPLTRITLDPYGYAGTNPIQITDPLGLSPNGLDLISTPLSAYDNIRTTAEGKTALQSALADHIIEATPVVSSIDSLNSAVKSAKKNDIVGTLSGVFGIIPGARYLGLASRLSKNGNRLLNNLEKVKDFEDGLGVILGLPFKSAMVTPDYCAVAFV
jgi:RHS repeat-associated protein